jgi:hypothetical protein
VLTNKVDIFACGLILFELSSNFKTLHEKVEAFNEIRSHHRLPKTFALPFETELVLMMTEYDPIMRPTAEEVLESPTFASWAKELGTLF